LKDWWFPPPSKRKHKKRLPALGMLVLAAMIREYHQVWYVDNYIQRKTSEQLADWVLSLDCDVVGFGGTNLEWPQAAEVAGRLKQIKPEITTVYGGPNATARPKKHINYFDYVIRGMGEFAILNFLDRLETGVSLDEVKGLCYSEKQGNASTAYISPPVYLRNLNLAFLPAYGMIRKKDYTPNQIEIITSRGCPFQCRFCSSQYIWNRFHIRKTVDRVKYEVKKCLDLFGRRTICFRDDNLTINKKWLFELCQILKPLDIEWICQARVSSIDNETVKMMKESGCTRISCGFESANDSTLQYIEKGHTKDQIIKAMDIFDKHKLRYTGGFMVGLPNEGKEEILNTLKFVKEARNRPYCSVSKRVQRFVGFPVSVMYDEIIKEGLVEYNWQDGELLFPKTHKLGNEEIEKLIKVNI